MYPHGRTGKLTFSQLNGISGELFGKLHLNRVRFVVDLVLYVNISINTQIRILVGELGEACRGGHGGGGLDVSRPGHHHPQVVLNHRKTSLNNKKQMDPGGFQLFLLKSLNDKSVSRSTGSFPTSFLSQIEADGVGEFHRQYVEIIF